MAVDIGYGIDVSVRPETPPDAEHPRFVRAFGDVGDALRDDAAFGVRETMIEECTTDAYPAHLRNSSLPVIEGESPAAQLQALRDRWLRHRGGGGYETMIWALNRLGYSSVQVWSTLDLKIAGAMNPFANLNNFFFVLIGQPNMWTGGEEWAGGPEYNDGTLWGLGGGTREDLEGIFSTIRKFKPATHSCRFVIIDVGPQSRTISMHERWELQPNGAYLDYYNRSYLVP